MYTLQMASASVDQITKMKSQKLRQTNAVVYKTNE